MSDPEPRPAASRGATSSPAGARPDASRRALLRRLVTLALGVAAFVAVAGLLRNAIGLEASSASIRSWVAGLGWWGPAAYVALVAFRHLLALPSSFILTVGGVCFPLPVAGLLGAIGVFATAVVEFALVRALRPAWLVDRIVRQAGSLERAVQRGTPLAVAASTAIPPSPMSFFHWAAALTPLPFATFALLVAATAPIRAFSLALLGSGLFAAGGGRVLVAVVALALLACVPLAFPRLRGQLWPTPDGAGPAVD